VLLLALLASACSSSASPSQDDVEQSTSTRPFDEYSPWNVPIPADPVLDEDSDGMVGALTADGGTGYALLSQYGIPVFEADSSTPTVSVTCTAQGWGECPLEGQLVPVPDEAEPSPGTDAAMVVIDRGAGRVYDFWQAERQDSGNWSTSWGTWAPIGGSGIGGEAGGGSGGATGAGINLLAGLIRVTEIQAGDIDHALALVSNTSCPDVYRYPATKTDGTATIDSCVPQGTRLQLDPSIDVEAIPGITPGEVAVAEALQTYGAYLRDSAGTALGVAFEEPADGLAAYEQVGFPWDYYNMPHIPWDSLRVLSDWDGS